MEEEYWKDGKEDGKWTRWHGNGQIARDLTWISGKLEGKQTSWHVNGQIKLEAIYKDGECISGDCD